MFFVVLAFSLLLTIIWDSLFTLNFFFFLTQSLLKESLILLTNFYSLFRVNLCILPLFVIVSSCLYPTCTPLALIL